MKKLIAILLSMSFALSIVACAKETEETKKKKKTKKTTEETEETSDPDDTTDEPSSETETEKPTDDTTEPTDTTETEAPTDTSADSSTSDTSASAQPSDGGVFTISNDLTSLGFYNMPTDRAYAVMVDSDGFQTVTRIQEHVDDYYFDATGFDNLDDWMDTIFGNLMDVYDTIYDDAMPAFLEMVKDGESHSDMYWECEARFFRGDSRITSFYIEEYSSETPGTTYTVHNFTSQDGRYITLDEVVTDRNAFADYVNDYLGNSTILPDYEKDTVKQLVDDIRNKKDILFTMTFDGLFFFSDEYDYKVPINAVDLSNCVNMSYFGSTPEYFALWADANRSVYWNLDDDAYIDQITAEIDEDEYGNIINLKLRYNNDSATIPSSDLPEDGTWYYQLELMKLDDGYYAYLSTVTEELGMTNYVFKFDGTKFNYVTYFTGMVLDYYAYDPEYIYVREECELLGNMSMYSSDYTMLNNGGMPDRSGILLEKDCVATFKKDYSVMEIDTSRNDLGEMTLPAGTPVMLLYIDFDYNELLFTTLTSDGNDQKYFRLDFSGKDYPVSINGEDQNEIFAGLIFGG